MYDLKDRVLLLTGAGGGIGKAIAEHFHELGARILLADLDGERLAALARTLDPGGERVIAVKYDAAVPEDATAAVETCLSRFGRLDFVIPAAAIYEDHPFTEMTDAQWRKTLAINLDGVFYICRRAVPVMADKGSIVIIASDAAHEGASPGHAHYGASKGAVLGLAKALAKELAPRLRVNAISPGCIDTPMIDGFMRRWGESMLAATPLKRLGLPREVATVAAFLCSDGAAFMTGQALHPNGGSHIGG